MTTDSTHLDPEEFTRRLKKLEQELNLKDHEIRTLRRSVRELEAAYWKSSKEEPKKTPPAAAPAPIPPPLPLRLKTPVKAPEEEPVVIAPTEPAPARAIIPPTPKSPEPAPARSSLPLAPKPPAPVEAIVSEDIAEAKPDLETKIGEVWFNRIGLVALIVGFALLARLIVPSLEPWHKVGAMYLVSAVMLGLGFFFDRNYRTFARPVAAGGLSLAFFASFASSFIDATTCLPLWVSLTLMMLSTAGILACAERWASEPTAGLAVFLGHVGAYVGGAEAGAAPAVAILLLTATAALLFVRHAWRPLSLFAVVAAFLSHFLWASQQQGAADPTALFWLNFAFLTSYYVIFVLADFLLGHRSARATGGDESVPATGGVGPVAMVLYSVMVIWLFHVTTIYWSSLHVFLLAFAAVQMGLTVLYASKRDAGYGLYAVASALFLTLGVFAWFDGLSLTLTLAAEGLVIMMLARRPAYRFMHPVSQVVLATGFIHYWTWGASPSSSWPDLLSHMAAALAFLLAAYIEERWPDAVGRPDDATEAQRLDWLHPRHTAALHAMGAGFMAAHQIGISFPVPAASLVFGMAVGCVLLPAMILRARCWAWAIWILQLWLTLTVMMGILATSRFMDTPDMMASIWAVHQSVALALAVGASVAMLLGYAKRRAHLLVTGAGMLILGVGIPAMAPFTGRPVTVFLPLVAAVPVLYWMFGVVGRKPRDTMWVVGDGWLRSVESAVTSNPLGLRVFLAGLGAILLNLAVWQAYPAWEAGMILTAAGGLVLAVLLGFDAAALAAGLILHFALMLVHILTGRAFQGLELEGQHLGWIFGGYAVTACTLSVMAFRRRRGSFVMVGRWSLTFLTEGALVALFLGLPIGRPLWVWLALMVLAWACAEQFAVKLGKVREDVETWRDRYGLAILCQSAKASSMLHSCTLTLLLFLVLQGHGLAGIALCWALFIAALVLVTGALLLRSPRLTTAYALTVAAIYWTLLTDIGPPVTATGNLLFISCLAVLTLSSGTTAETIFRSLTLSGTAPGWRAGLSVLRTTFYVAGIGLGLLELHGRWVLSGAALPMSLPVMAAFLFLILLPAVVMRLPHLTHLVLAALVGVLMCAGWWIAFGPAAYRDGLLWAAVLTAIQLILIERILAGGYADFLDLAGQNFRASCRTLAVAAAGLLMLLACAWAVGMQGYLTTLGWSLTALVFMAAGFAWKERPYRYTALVIFLLGIGRAVLVDSADLAAVYRVLAFICLGACLLLVSFLYARYKDRIRRWL